MRAILKDRIRSSPCRRPTHRRAARRRATAKPTDCRAQHSRRASAFPGASVRIACFRRRRVHSSVAADKRKIYPRGAGQCDASAARRGDPGAEELRTRLGSLDEGGCPAKERRVANRQSRAARFLPDHNECASTGTGPGGMQTLRGAFATAWETRKSCIGSAPS